MKSCDTSDRNLSLGARVIRALLSLPGTDKEKAHLAGISPHTLRSWREGRGAPSEKNLTRIFTRMGADWTEAVLAPFLPTYDADEARREMTEIAERIAARRARRRRLG